MIREFLRRGYRVLLPLIYSRANYKLFLKMSFGGIDLRLQQLAAVSDTFASAIQPIPITAPFGKSMLVVAPHQDDEAIGCGGALALQVRAGGTATVVVMQDGGDEHAEAGFGRQQLVDLRNEESRRCAGVLGIAPPRFLNHVSLAAESRQATDELRSILIEQRVDCVFVPFFLDAHPDHRTSNYILADALSSIDRKVRVFGYEVWGLCVPNVIVVIDKVIDEKIKMLSCFDFANKAVDYVHSTKGLNMYHSRMLGAGVCQYAERFFEIPAREYIELVQRIRALESSQKGER